MANKPRKCCAAFPCPNLAEPGSAYCLAHQPASTPATKKTTDPFYSSARWQRYRRWYRTNHPLCESCMAKGKTVPMAVVDHIVPIKDGGAPYDPSNTQSLCHRCHNRKTGQERSEKGPQVYSYAKNHR